MGCVGVVIHDVSCSRKEVIVGVDFARVSKEGVEGGMIGHEEEVIMGNQGSH